VTTEPARSAGSEFAGSGTVMLARSTRVRARRSPRLPAARGALAASVVLRGADAAARVGPHRGGIPGRPAGRLRPRPRGASLQVADNETREFAEFARCDAVRAFLTRRQLFEAIERPAVRALPERSIFMACLRSECRGRRRRPSPCYRHHGGAGDRSCHTRPRDGLARPARRGCGNNPPRHRRRPRSGSSH